jgi:hypothetical protein
MLNPHPKRGDRIWGNDVAQTTDGEFIFVPQEVTFLCHDRGLIWYSHDVNPKPNENGWGWYASTFFHTKEESQAECDLLNQEAKGIVTERMQKEREKWREWAQRAKTAGPFQILP